MFFLFLNPSTSICLHHKEKKKVLVKSPPVCSWRENGKEIDSSIQSRFGWKNNPSFQNQLRNLTSWENKQGYFFFYFNLYSHLLVAFCCLHVLWVTLLLFQIPNSICFYITFMNSSAFFFFKKKKHPRLVFNCIML